MNGAIQPPTPQPKPTTPKQPSANKPRPVPLMWIGGASLFVLGIALGTFLLSPTPTMPAQAQNAAAPWSNPVPKNVSYASTSEHRVAVAYAPTPKAVATVDNDAHTSAEQHLASDSATASTSEEAIMASHLTPAWASAATVVPTPQPVRVAVVYDARQNDRPTLIADRAQAYEVPPIPSTPSANVHLARIDGSADMVMPDVESTPGPVTIPAGSRIAGVLDQSVDSDLAGPVRAHVAADVCDPRTGAVAIPRGSWLLGRQGDGVLNGTRHLGILWTRLTYPDLSSRLLIGTDTLDREGHSGIVGRPNLTGWQTFRDTLTSSLADSAGQIASQAASARIGSGSSTVSVDVPSAVNVAGPNAPNRRQSWTIDRNTQFFLYLERDFDRDAPYRNQYCGQP